MARFLLCCLILAVAAGCGTPQDTLSDAQRRLDAETEMLDSMEADRDSLVANHQERVAAYGQTPDDAPGEDGDEQPREVGSHASTAESEAQIEAKIEALRAGHQADLRRVDEEIGRQVEVVERAKEQRDALMEPDTAVR